jgi:hypothetical protein
VLVGKVHIYKLEVEKFSGNNKFELRKLKMQDLLVQQGWQKDLVGNSKKLKNMTDEDWEDLDERTISTICLYARTISTICLSLEDQVFFNVVQEET